VDLGALRERLRGRFAVAGGINSSVTLGKGDAREIRTTVRSAVQTMGQGGGFILAPVDALFPDTPWESVKTLIDAWHEVCG
jgi:uroporphyrinogen-III decarboxylase